MFELVDNMPIGAFMACALGASWFLSSLCELFEE